MADSDLSQQTFKNTQQRPRRRLDRWELDEIRAAQEFFHRTLWGCVFFVILAVIGLSIWGSLVPAGPPVYSVPYSASR